MIKYVFKDSPITIKNGKKASAQKIGEAIFKIAGGDDGQLKRQSVVDAARSTHHVLHKHFDWDDTVAAEKWRCEQAGELIRVVRIVDDDSGEKVPAFISITDKGGVAYRTHHAVVNNTRLLSIALEQAERDLAAWEKRLAMFNDICDLVRQARERMAEKRANMERAAFGPRWKAALARGAQ